VRHFNFLPKSVNENYQLIRNLFGAYFHQDWDIYGDDWQVVLSEALLNSPASKLSQIQASVESLLLDKTDQELPEMLHP